MINQAALDLRVKNPGSRMQVWKIKLRLRGNVIKHGHQVKVLKIGWKRYKVAKKEAKKAMGKAKAKAFDWLCQSLGTKNGEKTIYMLAKGMERKTRDLEQVKCFKNE